MKKLISFLPGGSISATILLILLLIVPFKVYEFISSGTNNFVSFAIIGDENHKIPSYKFKIKIVIQLTILIMMITYTADFLLGVQQFTSYDV